MLVLTVPSLLAGALAFLLLTVLMLTVWEGRERGALLVFACAISTIWWATLAYHTVFLSPSQPVLRILEVLRTTAWLAVLWDILSRGKRENVSAEGWIPRPSALLASLVGILVSVVALPYIEDAVTALFSQGYLLALSQMLLAAAGLVLVEQAYQITPATHRDAVRFLCLGLGVMFAYDFLMYLNALLNEPLGEWLWHTRGALNAVVVPFVAVAAARHSQWAMKIFVSRQVVFYAMALLGVGFYLLLTVGAAYYLFARSGAAMAAILVALSLGVAVMLIPLMSSQRLRSRANVFLNKHFFRSKYDYRKEWLRFTRVLSTSEQNVSLKENIIRAIASLVESPGGVLWVRQETGYFEPVAQWQVAPPRGASQPLDSSLIRFLEENRWVIYVDEYQRAPERYRGLALPEWLHRVLDPWLITPLLQQNDLLGFIVLARGASKREFNFEDSDLLKTVGRQAASYLALLSATEALAEARQFEAFNRLASYVVHDLKNLVAQLSLVVANAQFHRHNPAFMEDAIHTVANATARMNRLLSQLHKGRRERPHCERVSFSAVVRKVVEGRATYRPIPTLECGDEAIFVTADPDRLAAIVEHLLQNAQEATPAGGRVTVRLYRQAALAVMEVEDTGSGMDRQFVAQRLFRPFDTTKGNAGMGIGVYESREFVRAHGGDIAVESTPGQGTLFRIRLPLASQRQETKCGVGEAQAIG